MKENLEGWEKEFDEEFPQTVRAEYAQPEEEFLIDNTSNPATKERIKSFISLTLAQERNKWEKERGQIKFYESGKEQGRYEERAKVVEAVKAILVDEINLAHTTESGKTSRLNSAYNRISALSDLQVKE